jgi:hypothetical protein
MSDIKPEVLEDDNRPARVLRPLTARSAGRTASALSTTTTQRDQQGPPHQAADLHDADHAEHEQEDEDKQEQHWQQREHP